MVQAAPDMAVNMGALKYNFMNQYNSFFVIGIWHSNQKEG